MSRRRDLWLLLPRPVRRLPADLAAMLAVVVLTNAVVFLPIVRESPVRVLLGLPFVLFVPGYVFIAALFPEAGQPPTQEALAEAEADNGDDSGYSLKGPLGGPLGSDRGIDGIERVALSFGLSIAITPLIGLALNFTPWGIRLTPIMVSLSGFTVAMTAVAAVRRWELPEDERFVVPYRAWLAAGREEVFEPSSRTDAVLNVALAASVVLALGSVGYAIAVPPQGEQFSEFYLLTEAEDGQEVANAEGLVADNYPTNITAGEPRSLVVGIGNQEHERANYTVVVEIQRVDIVENSTVVRESQELQRFRTTLPHNETWLRQHTVAPRMTGENLRLQYLLYRGDPSDEIDTPTAYRDLHLWVNVSSA